MIPERLLAVTLRAPISVPEGFRPNCRCIINARGKDAIVFFGILTILESRRPHRQTLFWPPEKPPVYAAGFPSADKLLEHHA